MPDSPLDALLRQRLAARRQAGQLRCRSLLAAPDAAHVQQDGRTLVNFASNGYLGLGHHPSVRAALAQAAGQAGGAGASALVSGYGPAHAAAESALARWKQTEAAVLLPSGYQAAHAAVQTLAAAGQRGQVRFLLDRLAHASLIDAVQASGQPYRVFPHNGLEKLHRLLSHCPPGQVQVVVTESIFSMDGDAADLAGLARLKSECPFVLLLDEAHGSGVYGPNGSGYAAERGLGSAVDVSLVTLSKAMGLAGGAICASRVFCAALVNFGRAYIYSTAVAPALAAAAVHAIAVMADEPHRQDRVRRLARLLRQKLAGSAQVLGLADCPIVPVVLGGEARAVAAAAVLRERGFWVAAVRPPTVPRGASRLRISLCCEHTEEQVLALASAIVAAAGALPAEQ